MLSKTSRLIHICTPLGEDISRLVGELLGTDVAPRKGELYLVLHNGERTYLCLKNDEPSFLGNNRIVHLFKILSNTACAYRTVYDHSTVICHNPKGPVCKFLWKFCHLKNKKRRFFPNKHYDVQKYLREYVNMPFPQIPNIGVTNVWNNFFVDLKLIKNSPFVRERSNTL